MNTNTNTITCNAATAAYAEIARLINLANLDMSVAKFRTDIKSTNLYWVKRDGRSEWSYRGGRDVDGNLLTVAGLLETNITSIIEVVKGEGRSVILNIVEVAQATPAVETTAATEINPGYLAIYAIGDNGNNGNVFIRSLKNENERFYCEISYWEIAGRTLIGTLPEIRAWLSSQLPCQPIRLIFGLSNWEDNSDSLGIATEVPAPQASAAPDVLTMPHNPFLNELGFYTQIRRFIGLELGTDCKIEFMKHSGRHGFIYRVTTSDGVVYKLEKVGVLNNSYHRFTKANDTDFEKVLTCT